MEKRQHAIQLVALPKPVNTSTPHFGKKFLSPLTFVQGQRFHLKMYMFVKMYIYVKSTCMLRYAYTSVYVRTIIEKKQAICLSQFSKSFKLRASSRVF